MAIHRPQRKSPTVSILNPNDPNGPRIDATLPLWLVDWMYRFHPLDYENLHLAVRPVLQNPDRIFEGVREYREGGWCFCGRPKEWIDEGENRVAFPTDRVFCVFLNPGFVYYTDRAEPVASDDAMSPANWSERFAAIRWTRNTS